ncbi:hypothetical protein ASC90_09460 [Rhizobium sp. Root1220]|nr:hypothetical protein ASC90_09460 [Rhizobium sp. Root1220]
MGWEFVVAFLVGAACALRMPVLVFTIVVLIVLIAYAAASYTTGSSALSSMIWAFIFAAVLEAGYLVSHGILYLVYVKGAGRERKRSSADVSSKYSAD